MTRQIIIGFTTEGITDNRFLLSIIQRSFEDVALECTGTIEVLPVQFIEKQSGAFVEVVKDYAKRADEIGIMVLCVHADADSRTDAATFTNKINPAFDAVRNLPGNDHCRNLVALVPVQMTEAWMLADKELLKTEIGTHKNDSSLGIARAPEDYADPKTTIESAIRIARQALTRRRRHDLTIADLYSPIGQKVSLNTLGSLQSYQKFKEAIRSAFSLLNYLQDLDL